MEYFNIRSVVRGDPLPWSERTFPLIRAREICSFTGLSHLQRIMMHLPWDNRLYHFSSSNRAAPPNYHLFFILFSETVLFHVPLIQMVGMIIGAPNVMQPIFACYFTHVCAGVQHSLWQQKQKHAKQSDTAVLESLGRILLALQPQTNKFLFILSQHNFHPPPIHKSAH